MYESVHLTHGRRLNMNISYTTFPDACEEGAPYSVLQPTSEVRRWVLFGHRVNTRELATEFTTSGALRLRLILWIGDRLGRSRSACDQAQRVFSVLFGLRKTFIEAILHYLKHFAILCVAPATATARSRCSSALE